MQVLVYGKYECFVMQMLYVCVLCASRGSPQCLNLHDTEVYTMDEVYSSTCLITAL